jgi:hypothetical protein
MNTMDALEYRAAPLRYRLVDNDLLVDTGAETRRLPLSFVHHVRIYVASGRRLCVLKPKSGRPLVVSAPVHTDTSSVRAYAAFVRALHVRLAAVAPDATLVYGHGAFFVLHVVSVVAIVVYAVAFLLALFAGLPIAHLVPSLPSIVLPIVFLTASSRGRPVAYSRGTVPASFLPA